MIAIPGTITDRFDELIGESGGLRNIHEWRNHLGIQGPPPAPPVWNFGLAPEGMEVPQLHDPLIILRFHRVSIAPTARVDSYCKLEGGLGMIIGAHVHIASFCHIGIGGGVTILEAGTSFASGAKVISGSNLPGLGRSCSAVAPGNVIVKSFAHIKRNAVLFTGAIVVPGVTVGEGAVLGAGSIALEDIPDGEIWAGNPARKIGEL